MTLTPPPLHAGSRPKYPSRCQWSHDKCSVHGRLCVTFEQRSSVPLTALCTTTLQHGRASQLVWICPLARSPATRLEPDTVTRALDLHAPCSREAPPSRQMCCVIPSRTPSESLHIILLVLPFLSFQSCIGSQRIYRQQSRLLDTDLLGAKRLSVQPAAEPVPAICPQYGCHPGGADNAGFWCGRGCGHADPSTNR